MIKIKQLCHHIIHAQWQKLQTAEDLQPIPSPTAHYSNINVKRPNHRHTIVCLASCAGSLQRRHQSSVLLALCLRKPPVAGRFPAQRASTAESVSMPWRHPFMMIRLKQLRHHVIYAMGSRNFRRRKTRQISHQATHCPPPKYTMSIFKPYATQPAHRQRISQPVLTHWGRETHICVRDLTITGSDNGLSPGRRQVIIWTYAVILLIEPLGTNFNEIAFKNALHNVVCEIAAICELRHLRIILIYTFQ